MEGMAAVQQRIRAIESQFAARLPAATPAAAAPTRSFDATLAAAQQVQHDKLTPATKLAPGQYGKLQPPTELTKYGNGRIPADAMHPIGVGQHRLWEPAAKAFTQLRADAERAGVTIGVTDSYRDMAGQEKVAREKGLHSQGGLAARPGTSNHGWGVAVDLDLDARAQTWMRDNGHRYGFVEDVTREPWHWTYRPNG